MGLRINPGAGGSFNQALRSILEKEAEPIRTLQNRRGIEEQRLNLFREFKSEFSSLDSSLAQIANRRDLTEYKVDLGDGAQQMSVLLDKNRVQPGSYEIQIDELAARSSMISNGFTDPNDANLGIGFVVVYTPDDKFEVFIDEDSASLRGIAGKINALDDAPIRATVIKDAFDSEKPWRILLSAKEDGLDDYVDFPEFYFLDGDEDFWIDGELESRNATMKIDGFEIETDGNKVEDFIQGVNIHLKQAKPGQAFTMTISEDPEKITVKVKDVIDQVNGVLQFINEQNQVDEKSDTRAQFTGDTSLQAIEYRLRNLMHEGFPVWEPEKEEYRIVHLHDLGITFNRQGGVTFNEAKFSKSLDEDYQTVAEAVSGEYGFAFQLRETLKGYTRPFNGLLALRERSLNSRIQQIDNNIENKERNLQQRQESLTRRFARLEASLGALQQQQAALSSIGGGGGGLVSQLLG